MITGTNYDFLVKSILSEGSSSYLGDDLNFYSFGSMLIICGRKGIVRVEIVCPVMGFGLCINGMK